MSATRAGGLKASKTNRQRYGEDYYKTIGRNGGLSRSAHNSDGSVRGFGISREHAVANGKKGGEKSATARRAKAAESR